MDDRIWKDVPDDLVATAMLDGVRDLAIRLEKAAARLAARVELIRAEGGDLPDFSLQGLTDTADDCSTSCLPLGLISAGIRPNCWIAKPRGIS